MKPAILLVTRQNILIETLQRQFGDERLLRTASSVEHGRKLLNEFSPDIVVVDVDIMEGLEFVTELRANNPRLHTVGLTDFAEKRKQLQAAGIETILLKHDGVQPILDAVKHYSDHDATAGRAEKTEVLVVDDEKELLSLFSRMLDTWGYAPLTANSGDKAIEIVDRHPRIGAILLDLGLPGKGGMEILREIQKRNPRTGVIMLSGLADSEVVQQALKLGAFDYVTKPPDFPALQHTLISCVSHTEFQSQSWWKKLMG